MDKFIHWFLPSCFLLGKEKRDRLTDLSKVARKSFIFEMMSENIFIFS